MNGFPAADGRCGGLGVFQSLEKLRNGSRNDAPRRRWRSRQRSRWWGWWWWDIRVDAVVSSSRPSPTLSPSLSLSLSFSLPSQPWPYIVKVLPVPVCPASTYIHTLSIFGAQEVFNLIWNRIWISIIHIVHTYKETIQKVLASPYAMIQQLTPVRSSFCIRFETPSDV